MKIVSDTGPLIALAKADCLPVLEQLFGKVHIPPEVHRELLGKRGPEAARLEEALTHFIEVVQTPSPVPEVQVATWRLDAGEQQAIGLAHELGVLLAIDDRQGRRAARALDLSITGVVGILIQAKEVNFLSMVRPVLDEIRRRGYWLSDELVDMAVSAAGED